MNAALEVLAEWPVDNAAAASTEPSPMLVRTNDWWPPAARSAFDHATDVPPLVAAARIRREVMSTRSSERPSIMNSKPSSLTIVLRAMPLARIAPWRTCRNACLTGCRVKLGLRTSR